jgi:WD40 repeat protein
VAVRGCGKCDQASTADVLRTFVYNTTTGEELWRVRRACCAAFSGDGTFVAVPQNVLHMSVIDVATGERVRRVDSWGAVAFSPDGSSCSSRQTRCGSEGSRGIRLRRVRCRSRSGAGAPRGRGEGNIPNVYADWNPWSADGSMIAIPTSTGKVYAWYAQTGEEKFVLKPPAGDFTFTGFNVDGSLLAVASTDGTATVFDLSETSRTPSRRSTRTTSLSTRSSSARATD